MAMLHSPEMLQLLLGDFKGESAFARWRICRTPTAG